jgi:hypothetical protein
VVTFDECVARYRIEDSTLAATHDLIDEYTYKLEDTEFYDAEGARVRKYRVLKDAPLPNGKIVIATERPCTKSVEVYASTVHAFQGKAVDYKLYMDSRRMFELQHWYTAVSRARRLEQLFYVDAPTAPPQGDYANTVIYIIRSPNTTWVYIGHTTVGAEKRFRGHQRDFANTTLKKRCSSGEVLKHGDARVEVLEAYPCANKAAAEARERYWIDRTPECVNKQAPGAGAKKKAKRV